MCQRERKEREELGWWTSSKTWWTFRIFFIFSCSGRGKGESEEVGRGGSIFIENPKRGVFRRGRARGAGRVSAPNGGFLGGVGDLNIFLGGRNVHQEEKRAQRLTFGPGGCWVLGSSTRRGSFPPSKLSVLKEGTLDVYAFPIGGLFWYEISALSHQNPCLQALFKQFSTKCLAID